MTAESGPGMASSYHRRIFVDPAVATGAIQTFLANGVAQLGMYMYHGGTDPHGALFPMQELQGVGEGGANDMPCRTYDFHAPLGEGGQPRGHYHGIHGLSDDCALRAADGTIVSPQYHWVPGPNVRLAREMGYLS